MIDWLSEWLKDIIIIVLLAAFVDLLLPSSNMQKYAKMILGLLIILTIISPILGIFNDENAIAGIIEREYQSLSWNSQKIDMNLNTDEQYQEQMLQQVEKTMTKELQGYISDDLAINIADIKLKAAISQEAWTIEQLNIYVTKGDKKSNKAESVTPIESVQEVNITIKPDKTEKNDMKEIDTENQHIISEIIKLVKTKWGIAEEIIYVIIR